MYLKRHPFLPSLKIPEYMNISAYEYVIRCLLLYCNVNSLCFLDFKFLSTGPEVTCRLVCDVTNRVTLCTLYIIQHNEAETFN